MTEDDLFDFFVEERVSHHFEKIPPREELSNTSMLSEEQIFIQNLSEEQQDILSKYIQITIDTSAAQEKYLYKCGFQDGIKLMKKIKEL